MDVLRDLFADLGHTDVETFIASGNVIFQSKRRDASRIAREIEEHLRAELGYDVATMVRTPAEVSTICGHACVERMAGRSLYVGFTAAKPHADAGRAAESLQNAVSEIVVDGREVYWLVEGKLTDTGLSNGAIEKRLGIPVTFRNITTVKKLAAKYG
jgi:uncharacterized protein (DUF1697 family)